MAIGCTNYQLYHFGVGASPSLIYFSGDWDVHQGYGNLTHGQLEALGSAKEGVLYRRSRGPSADGENACGRRFCQQRTVGMRVLGDREQTNPEGPLVPSMYVGVKRGQSTSSKYTLTLRVKTKDRFNF